MKKKKKLSTTLRNWHRDLGYLVIGITIIYSISGMILSVRDLHLFEKEYILNATIEKNIKEKDLQKEIVLTFTENEEKKSLPSHIIKKSVLDKFELLENNNELIKYQISRKKDMKFITYYKTSGELIYSINGYPTFINALVKAHKSSSQDKWSYLALAYSIILFFLAISAIFMVKGKYGFRQRGLYLTLLGIALVIIFLYL
ncbi:hypothetical protein CRV01_10165 [Arcobacter sp. CECT 8983]|uniref:hypothetical protein n=1 Tax=Arcobacter sp. CECT 8983 TaxID=2044508 RepID=UPI00100C108D|nr:hypothetical protein [Arcobacter sp. CECT 8983]RXJ88977.1 hypothetical protein CRV01_10165 [Arcobacter sp. CECT 8983]